ncbi:hypothetical protein [Bradyrhizobium nitroreducens]|uniref:hypothetical protein n=1 Tax=Bradyrhizobium nitroreducens TaxID=709803 RepID=UPI00157FA0D0|nr:hypothetical protein [Bradyrhizobium nitroreducens]
MKAWQVARDWSIEGMEPADLPEPVPGPGAVSDRVFSFDAVPDALRLMQQGGGHFGKIVVEFDQSVFERSGYRFASRERARRKLYLLSPESFLTSSGVCPKRRRNARWK